MSIREYQSALHTWRLENFPDCRWEDQLMGVMEELGELTHALLKQHQNIRGRIAVHEENAMDAVGDLLIFLAGLCSLRGWDMESIFEQTAETVMGRDWVNYPTDGVKS